MLSFSILLICVLPWLGWVLGRAFGRRLAGATPRMRAQAMMAMLLSGLPWLPFGLICFSGVLRFSFPAAVVLMYCAAFLSARRAAA